jgi:hypothetical protein
VEVPPNGTASAESDNEKVEEAIKDMNYISHAVNQRITSFSWPLELQFCSRPSAGVAFSSEFTLTHPSNRGPCGVSPKKHAETSRLCVFEDWLIGIYALAANINTYENERLALLKDRLIQPIFENLRRIDKLKASEWLRQVQVDATSVQYQQANGTVFLDTSNYLLSSLSFIWLIWSCIMQVHI